MSAKKVNDVAIEIFIFTAALFVLFLTSININNYLTPKTVLGAKTLVEDDSQFWNEFLSKNPTYIPGLIETGNIEKAREIDPNYITP
jgi:hypothetical protein